MNKKLLAAVAIVVILLVGIVLSLMLGGEPEEEVIERVGPPASIPGPADIVETTLVDLFEVDGSGQSGFVTIDEFNGETKVAVQLIGESNENLSAILRSGSCAAPGAVISELNDFSGSRSETSFELPVGEVTGGGSFLIAVFLSDDSGEIVACGNR